GRAEHTAKMSADLAASNAMLDPKTPDAFITATEREAAVRFGMRKEGAVEIEPQAVLFRPIYPCREMRRTELIALDGFSVRLRINCVQIEAMLARNEPECLLQIVA